MMNDAKGTHLTSRSPYLVYVYMYLGGYPFNQWEHGKKQGFKCTFERGVLQLFFNFKRHRYRR